MGASWIKRSLAVAVKLVLALLGLLLAILIALRIAATLREGPAASPPGMHYFAAPGARVAARIAGPADGPRVVLVHGSAGWSGFWANVTKHLADRGWRVIAVDLPPFGWSDRDPEGRYGRIAQSERLAAVLTASGSEPIMVVAHSFGAGAAIELALRHPQRLRGLVLVDAALGEFDQADDPALVPALRVQPVAELFTAATVTNPWAMRPLLRPMLARKDSADAWLDVLKAPMQREGTTSAYAAWLPSLIEQNDGALSRSSAELRKIRVPVALIWGGADTVTPLNQGQQLASLTRAKSLAILDGVGHIPHIEDPDGFLAALDAALPPVGRGRRAQ